jgi:hypothetical protein
MKETGELKTGISVIGLQSYGFLKTFNGLIYSAGAIIIHRRLIFAAFDPGASSILRKAVARRYRHDQSAYRH